MTTRCFEVRKDDPAETRWVDDPQGLQDGQVRCAVDLCALTANNVTYAVMAERFGYFRYYPAADDGWGRVPVWGFAEVKETCHPDIEAGERLYGYWPMGEVATLTPGKVAEGRFSDESPHREGLPQAYNDYARLGVHPDTSGEAYRALFYPLAGTSYGLADYLAGMDFLGAGQIVCTAASSKTALGTAMLLAEREGAPPVLGLTSERNAKPTKRVGAYKSVATYDDLAALDDGVPTVIVDFAGDGALSARLHERFGPCLLRNVVVGAAHPDAERRAPGMNDERTELFFMPGYAAERMKATGGRFVSDMREAAGRVAEDASGWMRLAEARTEEEIEDLWRRVLRGALGPDEGGVVHLSRQGRGTR